MLFWSRHTQTVDNVVRVSTDSNLFNIIYYYHGCNFGSEQVNGTCTHLFISSFIRSKNATNIDGWLNLVLYPMNRRTVTKRTLILKCLPHCVHPPYCSCVTQCLFIIFKTSWLCLGEGVKTCWLYNIFKIDIGLSFLIYKFRLSVIEYRDCNTANRIGVIFVIHQMPLPLFLV